jgi:hypothetical protein
MSSLVDSAVLHKLCPCCKTYKELHSEFHRNRASKDGYCDECKICRCKKQREYVCTHRNQENERRRRWEEGLKDTPEGRRKLRTRAQKSSTRQRARYHLNKVTKPRKPRVPGRRVKWTTEETKRIHTIARSVRESIHKKVRYTVASQKYTWFACTYDELHRHLGERPSGWELDHICPLAQATTVAEYKALQHHLNLRWVPPEVNLQKGNKASPAGEGLCLFLLKRPFI